MDWVLVACSFRLFGQTTWAGRFPFVVAGLASLAVFGILVRRTFRDRPALGLYALAALGFSVVFLLNIRQCRYYSIGLLFALLSYLAYQCCLEKAKLTRFLAFGAAVVALFYSSFLYCAAFLGALAIVHLVFHRDGLKKKDFWKLGIVMALVAAATVPYAVAHQIWYRPDIARGEPWYQRKPVLLWWNVRDLDMLGLPWMMAVALIAILAFTWRKDKNVRRFLEFACLAVGYAVFVALLSPQPVKMLKIADIRYLLPAVPFLAVLVAAVVHFVHRREKLLAAVLFLAVVCTNLFSAHPGGWRFRWLLPAYIHEVHHDYPTAYSQVIAFLRQHVRQDDRVYTIPDYTTYPLMFYLGDKIRLCCLLDRHTPLPWEKVEAMERAGAPLLIDRHFPDWIVLFGLHGGWEDVVAYFSRTHVQDGKPVRMDYQIATLLDVFWDDTSRPELHLHSFGPLADFDRRVEGVYILKGTLVPVDQKNTALPPTTQPSS